MGERRNEYSKELMSDTYTVFIGTNVSSMATSSYWVGAPSSTGRTSSAPSGSAKGTWSPSVETCASAPFFRRTNSRRSSAGETAPSTTPASVRHPPDACGRSRSGIPSTSRAGACNPSTRSSCARHLVPNCPAPMTPTRNGRSRSASSDGGVNTVHSPSSRSSSTNSSNTQVWSPSVLMRLTACIR